MRIRKKNSFFLFVAIGATLGSILRVLLFHAIGLNQTWILLLIVNSLGSFIIGFIYGLEHRLHPNFITFGVVGFCGGFTTFSHFAYHNFKLIESGFFHIAMLNIMLSLLFGLFFAWLGFEGSSLKCFSNKDTK